MDDLRKVQRASALALLTAITGAHVWGVQLGADHALRMDFGQPHLYIREPYPPRAGASQRVRAVAESRLVIPEGEWHLFIESGHWQVRAFSQACVRPDADAASARQVLLALDGQILTAVTFDETSLDWVFMFDLGGELRIGPGCDRSSPTWQNEPQWTLFSVRQPAASYTNGGALV